VEKPGEQYDVLRMVKGQVVKKGDLQVKEWVVVRRLLVELYCVVVIDYWYCNKLGEKAVERKQEETKKRDALEGHYCSKYSVYWVEFVEKKGSS